MITISTVIPSSGTPRMSREARRDRRLDQRARAMKKFHDRLFAEGKCINHTVAKPHAPRRPNGRRCDPCCEIRRVAS